MVPDGTPTTPLAERILDAFPSGSYALSGLLRLLDIVETTSVPTAAVLVAVSAVGVAIVAIVV
ncbi:MAG: hypothetical protein WCQ48_02520, partial [Chloroflexota bacterium]